MKSENEKISKMDEKKNEKRNEYKIKINHELYGRGRVTPIDYFNCIVWTSVHIQILSLALVSRWIKCKIREFLEFMTKILSLPKATAKLNSTMIMKRIESSNSKPPMLLLCVVCCEREKTTKVRVNSSRRLEYLLPRSICKVSAFAIVIAPPQKWNETK